MHSTLRPRFAPARVLVLGMGDLGAKIAQLVVESGLSSTCLLAGRSGSAKQWAQLLHISSGNDVRSAQADGQDLESVRGLLTDFEPQLIVQCATLLSPYALRGVNTKAAAAVLKGGFALQAAAQLPIIRTVMQARQQLGMRCPVINCSYPDLTNAVLDAKGLTPDAGIGNVAIMALRFERLLGGAGGRALQVVGHHAQLGPSLAGQRATSATPVPLVYVNGRRVEDHELLRDSGLAGGPILNHLAAVTALPVIRGFIEQEVPLDTHAPGILGLPGGYPVRFMGGRPILRLPDGLSREDAVAFNRLAGAGEGIEGVGKDGTVFYTKAAQEAVASCCPELAEPLEWRFVDKRLRVLQRIAQG